MGRRRLMPNFNALLLRFHLPHRGHGTASGRVTANPSKESSAHPHHEDDDDHHHPHHHHIFTWASLKRKPSLSSLASSQGTQDDHDDAIAFETTHTEPTASIKTHASSHALDHSQKSRVSFGNCQVRTYTQVLGDHPCCSEGCPIQLGWSYTSEELIHLDEYETMHHPNVVTATTKASSSSASRSIHELRLTPDERRAILLASKRQQSLIETTCDNPNDALEAPASWCASATGELPQPLPLHHSVGDDDSVQQQQQQHERELIRECRRLNRCGGWNVNARASRRRNRNIQHHFFGTPHGNPHGNSSTTTTTPPPAPSGEC